MRTLTQFAILYFVIALISAFLHQVGHGIGAKIDGFSVSTGVALTGDYGKSPADPDFRSELPFAGRLTSGGLLGPFFNWALVIVFSFALSRRPPGLFALFSVAVVIANAWIRIFPFLKFLWSHVQGPLFLDDEATWALATIREYTWPSTYATLQELSTTQSNLVIGRPWVYFWPVVSLLICLAGAVLATRFAFRTWPEVFQTSRNKILFVLVPILWGPVLIPTALWLDLWVRINWAS